jgi:hypothetical protein
MRGGAGSQKHLGPAHGVFAHFCKPNQKISMKSLLCVFVSALMSLQLAACASPPSSSIPATAGEDDDSRAGAEPTPRVSTAEPPSADPSDYFPHEVGMTWDYELKSGSVETLFFREII